MQHAHLEYHNRADVDHWWFATRRRIVLDQLDRHLGERAAGRDLDVVDLGCGAGGMLDPLARYGRVCGTDDTPEAVAFAREKTRARVEHGGLPDALPFGPESFDVVTLLDVLEHIEDDLGSLRAIARLLRPGGVVLITVPACPFLWSEHDDINDHQRRYTRSGLRERLDEAGFRIHRLSYFNTLLFPPIAVMRWWSRLREPTGRGDEGNLPPALNALVRGIFSLEVPLLRWFSLPIGVSLLALAEPRKDEGTHDRP